MPPPRKRWSGHDWMTAGLATVLALCLVGFAVWQTLPPPAAESRTRQAARIRVEPQVADLSIAEAPGATPANESESFIEASKFLDRPAVKVKPAVVKAARGPRAADADDDDSPPLSSVGEAIRDFSTRDRDARDPPSASPARVVAAAPLPTREAAVSAETSPPEESPPEKRVAPDEKTASAAVSPVAPEKDARNDALATDEYDEYDESGADDFACPVAWLRESRMTEQVKYRNSLQALLKAGWEEKPTAPETAREHFETARKLCADDPRLGYAFGLALWKNGQHAAARKEWEAATRTGPQPFLPALAVLAWAALMDRDDAGFAAIERVAEAVAARHGEYPTAAQRSHATVFLGRAFGFLKGPGKSPELIDQVLRTEQLLLDALPDELRKLFEHGQAQAGKRFEEFQRLVERPVAEVVEELHHEQQRIADEIKSLRQELKQLDDRRRGIPREARTRLAALASEAAELEEKVAEYSAGIRQGQTAALALSQPRQIFAGYRTVIDQVPVTVKENGKDVTRYESVTRQVPQYRNENQQEVAARIKDRDQVVGKLKVRTQELQDFEDRLNAIPIEKNDLTKTLRHERQEKGRAATAARRKIVELTALERDLLKDFSTPDEIRKRMTTLAPYVPWTVDSDREGLVASYRQKTAPRPATAPRDRQKAAR